MQWVEAIAAPSSRVLRQFAGLLLALSAGFAARRLWGDQLDVVSGLVAGLGVAAGLAGLWRPGAIRFLFTGWMILVFPIGWTVSRLIVVILFYLVFTPVALLFRVRGRDALALRRRRTPSYWTAKAPASGVASYLRQS